MTPHLGELDGAITLEHAARDEDIGEGRKPQAGAAPSGGLGNILSGYLSADQLAEQLGYTTRTLQLWRQQRTGPPVTPIGRMPFYRIESIRAWLLREEIVMVREGQKRGRRHAK